MGVTVISADREALRRDISEPWTVARPIRISRMRILEAIQEMLREALWLATSQQEPERDRRLTDLMDRISTERLLPEIVSISATWKRNRAIWAVEAALAAGDTGLALELVEGLDPDDGDAVYLRACALVELGDLELAERLIASASASEEDGRFISVSERMEVRRASLALDEAERCLEIDVTEPRSELSAHVKVGKTPIWHTSFLGSGEWEMNLNMTLLRQLQESLRASPFASTDLLAWSPYVGEELEEMLGRPDSGEAMVDAWIGSIGRESPRRRLIAQYAVFIGAIDVLGLLPQLIVDGELRPDVLTADLGSAMDVNMLRIAAAAIGSEQPTILDIGGGYGRLAEAVVSWFDLPIRYVLTDMIPVSLVGAFDYLTRALPECSVELVIDGPMPEDCDIVIVPGWHEVFRVPNSLEVDLVCNIEAFQEMTVEQTGWWFEVSDSLLNGHGAFYCSNSRAYHNRYPWPVPHGWETAFWSETPRAWTTDHPSALFTAGVGHEDRKVLRELSDTVNRVLWRSIGT